MGCMVMGAWGAPSFQKRGHFLPGRERLAKIFRLSHSQDLEIDWTPSILAGYRYMMLPLTQSENMGEKSSGL